MKGVPLPIWHQHSPLLNSSNIFLDNIRTPHQVICTHPHSHPKYLHYQLY